MARTLTAQDAHTIMNLLVKEATGQDAAIQVVDSSTFVSAGEQVLATGKENTLNALSMVLGRTMIAVRPYNAKLGIINAIDSDLFSNRLRKISYYAREAKAAGFENTQLFGENLKDGADNGSGTESPKKATASMWEQCAPVPLEINFAGRSVWQYCNTVYEKQLQVAFRSDEEFAEFVNGIMVEVYNDIESEKEAFNRMTLLNKIAGTYDLSAKMPLSVVNLTEEFNKEFGTKYTSAELRGAHLKEFLAFFVSRFKITSDNMTDRKAAYHWTPDKTGYTLLRHTPKDKQRVILYKPLFTKSEAMVFPEIFNPQYLDIDTSYEGVNFWQNSNDPAAVKVTPAIPDTTNATGGQLAGDPVDIPYLVGILYDADGIMTDFQLEDAVSTPPEARKHYRNVWWSFAKNAINDFTENTVIFYMADPAPAPEKKTAK